MSILRLCHRSKGTTSEPILVPDGEHDWALLIDNCANCGKVYGVEKTSDRFCSEACKQKYHRPRKDPQRPYRSRKIS
jgi:hypothetical protein